MTTEEYIKKLQDIVERNAITDPSLKPLSRPGAYTELVDKNNIGETAYQRAIIQAGMSSLSGNKVTWLDIELPVVFRASSRRMSLDLIGESLIGKSKSKQLVLCELKYDKKQINPRSTGKPNTDSPLHAMLELLYYHALIAENAEQLQKSEIWHENKKGKWDWRACKNPNDVALVVAANKTYWERWTRYHQWEEIVAEISQIKLELEVLPPVSFYCTPNPSSPFSEQAKEAAISPDQKEGKSKETYRPTLGKSAETEWEKVSLK